MPIQEVAVLSIIALWVLSFVVLFFSRHALARFNERLWSSLFIAATWLTALAILLIFGFGYQGDSFEETTSDIDYIGYLLESPIDFGNAWVNGTVALTFNLLFAVNFISLVLVFLARIYDFMRRRITKKESLFERNRWGVVYDAVTKKGVGQALVRLFQAEGNTLVKTTTTTADGIFRFSLTPGSYRIIVQKAGFTFPSNIVAGKEDPPWTNVYHGDAVAITTTGEATFAIPVDPEQAHLFNKVLRRIITSIWPFLIQTNLYLLLFGLVYAMFGYWLWGSVYNMVPIPLYVMFIFSAYYSIQERQRPKVGLVRDKTTGQPVPNLPLGLYETEFNQLVNREFTDNNGRYRFIVPHGEYRLRILDEHYSFVSTHDQKLPEIHIPAPSVAQRKRMVINLPLTVISVQ